MLSHPHAANSQLFSKLGYFAALFWYSGIYHQLHDCINPNWGFYAILPWLSSGVVVYFICQVYRSLQKCSSFAFNDYHLFILKNFTRKFPWSTSQEKSDSLLWIKNLVYRQVVLFMTGMILLLCRWWIMGSSPPVFQEVDNPSSFEKSLVIRVSMTLQLEYWSVLDGLFYLLGLHIPSSPGRDRVGEPV